MAPLWTVRPFFDIFLGPLDVAAGCVLTFLRMLTPLRNHSEGVLGLNKISAITVSVFLLSAAMAFAGRPLMVDDADPVEPREFEAEAGSAYYRDSSCRHWDVPLGLTYGLFNGIEAGLGLGGQFERRTETVESGSGKDCIRENGIGDLTIGAKWQFIGETAWRPRQAFAPSVKFPTAEENEGLGSGETDYDLTWIASKALTERMGAHFNAGYSCMGEPSGEDIGDVVHYGIALDYRLTEPLQWIGEVFAEKALEQGGGTAVQYNSGVRWSLSDALVCDIAAGSRICGDGTPDFTVTAGLTWAFGFSGQEPK